MGGCIEVLIHRMLDVGRIVPELEVVRIWTGLDAYSTFITTTSRTERMLVKGRMSRPWESV